MAALLALAALPAGATAAVDTFLYEDLYEVFQQDLNGQNREYITSAYGADDFALGPAGDKVLSAGSSDIYLSAGGSDYVLFDGDSNQRDFVEHPHFHPDEGSVIFARSAPNDPNIWDLWSVGMNGTGLRKVLSWPGNQYAPVYNSTGTKIAFASERDPLGKDLRGSYIYVANADGSSPFKIAAGMEPTFSPDGTRVAFHSGGNIYAANASDGRNKVQVTRNGQSGDPDWSPDGVTIAYRRGMPLPDGRIFYEIWFVNSNGTNDRAYISQPSVSKFSPSFRQPSTTVTFDDFLAGALYPRVFFDTSEQWRPLQVERFFEEGGHTVDGTALASTGSLRSFPYSGSTLDVRGDGEEGNYTSPYSWCTSYGLRDCDSGNLTSGYYHVSRPSPRGYRYLDYWYFYRFNYFGSAPIANDFNHEADWEGVSIAPSMGATNTFDFASFSQHGTWFSYLRESLSCDGGGKGSCGSDGAKAGRRLSVFPANGSHANYGVTCSEFVYYACAQSDGVTPERGHDGAVEWGANLLTRFPANNGWTSPMAANWVDWPGKWGVQRDVSSPAAAGTGNGAHYDQPWGSDCFGGGSCAKEASRAARTALPARRTPVASASADSCGNWFGGDVSAIACQPGRLERALDDARLDEDGELTLRWPGDSTSASAPGIAQAVGRPLRPGQRGAVTGRAAGGAVLFARGMDLRRYVVARFQLPAGALDGAVEAYRDAAGAPRLRLVLADGRTIEPDVFRSAKRPRSRPVSKPERTVRLPRKAPGRPRLSFPKLPRR